MRLEISYNKNLKKKKNPKNKTRNMWQLNNILLNNQWITKKIKDKIKNYLETNENESTMVQNLWDAVKSSSEREVYRNSTSKNKQKSQIKNASLYLKQIEEEEEMKPKFSRRKRIMKITAEINEI